MFIRNGLRLCRREQVCPPRGRSSGEAAIDVGAVLESMIHPVQYRAREREGTQVEIAMLRLAE
jgi:hypothetical protein